MYADTLEELHAMAARIGMKRSWFQDKSKLPHYDLVPRRRDEAVNLGAVEHSRSETVTFMANTRRSRLTAARASAGGLLLAEGGVGKPEEDLARPIASQLGAERAPHDDVVLGEGIDLGGHAAVAALAGDHVDGWVNLPLLAVVHAHESILGEIKAK
jgi:Protein of unknown function (DUF4031)